ncbi:MAG: L-rhamnose mutarotase, partial [Flavobacteriaceae bacterium]
MQLKKGCEAEYKKRHDALWPELKSLLFQHGIDSYYIYLEEESGKLFAFQSLV